MLPFYSILETFFTCRQYSTFTSLNMHTDKYIFLSLQRGQLRGTHFIIIIIPRSGIFLSTLGHLPFLPLLASFLCGEDTPRILITLPDYSPLPSSGSSSLLIHSNDYSNLTSCFLINANILKLFNLLLHISCIAYYFIAVFNNLFMFITSHCLFCFNLSGLSSFC